MALLLLQLNNIIVIVVCVCVIPISSLCEVRAPGQSWPTPSLLIPVNSTVLINCTINQSDPHWLIDVPPASIGPKSFTDIGGQKRFLNDNGLYELQQVSGIEGEPSTLRLLINNTERNNQTVVKCVGDSRDVLVTTLFVYESSLVILEAMDTENMLQSSNLSWGSLPSLVDPEPKQTYTLTVKSPSIPEQTFQLYEPCYLFTALEGAPPCEVYNFSVTATYDVVGATYTGAGCSVPSPVISRMLPSLPDIDLLESSIDYSLEKQSGKKVTLTVSYQILDEVPRQWEMHLHVATDLCTPTLNPAKFCQDYPVENYTMVVESVVSTLHSESKETTSVESSLTVEDLSQDGVYTFIVYAQNSVGNVSTQAREIYTTDVQRVQVSEMGGKDSHMIRIQCDFMLGSDAGGCMVVVLGEFDNTTVNLTRGNNGNSEAVTGHDLAYSLSCYYQAYALDIEADGSLGSLSLPAILMRENTTLPVKCSPNEEAPVQRRSTLIIRILVPTIVLLLAAIFAVGVAIIMLQLKLKYSTQFPTSELSFPTSEQDGKAEEGLPLYAVPDKLKKSNGAGGVRISGDGAENVYTYQEPSTTSDTEKERENVALKTLSSQNEVQQQNVVTEMVAVSRGISPDPDAPPLPPPFNPDCAESPQHPVYDEVCSTRCPPSQPSEGVSSNHLTLESHSESQNPPMPSHVYQDISELSSRAREIPVQQHAQGNAQHASVDDIKAVPVYQDIGEICRARGPLVLPSTSRPTNGHSNAIELLSVLEIGSVSSNSGSPPPLPPRCHKPQNGTDSASFSGATPPLPPSCTIPQNGQLPVQIKFEADKPAGKSTNTNPGPSPSPESLPDHPKTPLPIYADISEVATEAAMVKSKRTLDLSELSIVVESDSTNSDVAYTPEPLPTPVYEDINEATNGVSRGASSSVHLQSPSPEHLSLHQSAEMVEDNNDKVVGELPSVIPPGGTLV